MTYLELEHKVFNAIKEQKDFADGLDYAMGEVFANTDSRVAALRNMIYAFIDELEELDVELEKFEDK